MKTVLALAGALAFAAPASAHEGDHSMSLLATIGHWLSSPSHALLATVAGLALIGFVAAQFKRA